MILVAAGAGGAAQELRRGGRRDAERVAQRFQDGGEERGESAAFPPQPPRITFRAPTITDSVPAIADGTPPVAAQPLPQPRPLPQRLQRRAPEPEVRRGGGVLAWVVLAAVVLGGAAVVFWRFREPKATPEPEPISPALRERYVRGFGDDQRAAAAELERAAARG